MGYWEKKEAKQKSLQQEEIIQETNGDIGDDEGIPKLEDFEQQCKTELSEWQQSFRDRMKKEEKRKTDVTDSEYYICVYFSNRAQCDEFLDTFGYAKDEKFVDGRRIAKVCNRVLQSPDTQFPRTQRISKDWTDRVKH